MSNANPWDIKQNVPSGTSVYEAGLIHQRNREVDWARDNERARQEHVQRRDGNNS
jgi:hypothetical protein